MPALWAQYTGRRPRISIVRTSTFIHSFHIDTLRSCNYLIGDPIYPTTILSTNDSVTQNLEMA